MMRTALAIVLVALVVPLPEAQAQAQPAGAKWWPPGQTEPDEGFHLRIPVTVRNDLGYPIRNGVVMAELDLRAKLIEAGWIHSGSGGTESLKGFHLDPNSFRVVAMNQDGSLRAVEPRFTSPTDPRRFEVPSVVFEGRLSGSSDHDPFVNPIVTVAWRVAGNLAAAGVSHFMVYFDTDLTNLPAKPVADYSALLAGGDVESLFWSGPAVALYGIVRPAAGAGVVEVIGTQPNTQVRVFSGAPGGAMSPVLVGSSPVFSLGAGQSRLVTLPSTGVSAVRIEADRPVLAEGTSTGFVPSVDGGMTGKEFFFSLRHGQPWKQDTIHFTKTGDADTVVQVDRLDAPGTFRFELDDTNKNPYTTGWRASMRADGGAACEADGPESPRLPAGPGLYRAHVTEGDRVMLQLQPVDGLSQAPSQNGAPRGDRLWAAVDWTDTGHRPGTVECVPQRHPIAWFASAADEGTTIRVTSPDVGYQVTPRGTLAFTPPPIGLSGGPVVDGPFEATLADRPLRFEASGPVTLFVGPYGAQTGADDQSPVPGPRGIPVAHGPFGGRDAGRSFAGLGASIVFAPFDDTKVEADVDYDRTSGKQDAVLTAGSTLLIGDRSAQDPVRSFSLESNRPVLVYPLAATSGFLAGVPALLGAEAGQAEYRGYLVGLRSAKGEDPVVESAAPGAPVTFDLEAINLGRRVGGLDLLDDINVTVERGPEVPAAWESSVSLKGSIQLHSNEKAAFKVTLRPPADAESGEFQQLTVRARSAGNPLVEDRLQVGVFVKKDYDVGLWFDDLPEPGTAGTKRKDSTGVNGLFEFDLVLQNTGSVPDTYEVRATQGLSTTWTTELLKDGLPVDSLGLAPLEVARFTLRAKPSSAEAGASRAVITVDATSATVPSVGDRVTAVPTDRTAASLRVEVGDDFLLVEPGRNATFDLSVINAGDVTGLQANPLQFTPVAGWGAPRVLEADADVPFDGIIENGTNLVRVVVQAPKDGLAGSTFVMRFGPKPAGAGEGGEAILTARVKAMHRVKAAVDGLPLAIETLGNATAVALRLTNLGNLDELLNVSAAELPAGWSLGASPDAFVGRNATKTTHVNLTAAAGAPPGSYNVTLRLTSRDGNRTLVPLPVVVGLVPGQRVGGTAGTEVQPGEVARVAVPVSNEGNTPLIVRAQAQPGEPWSLAPMAEVRLLPGEGTTLLLGWTVPASAPEGSSLHSATLAMTPEGGAAPILQAVQGRFDVARADLVVTSASTVPAPGGDLVRAVVENVGRRPARDFVVDLEVDGEPVDSIPVGELPAGGSVEVSFLQTRAGAGVVRADGNGTVVEAAEANNLREVGEGSGKPAPGLGLLLVAGALVLALATRRRGRA